MQHVVKSSLARMLWMIGSNHHKLLVINMLALACQAQEDHPQCWKYALHIVALKLVYETKKNDENKAHNVLFIQHTINTNIWLKIPILSDWGNLVWPVLYQFTRLDWSLWYKIHASIAETCECCFIQMTVYDHGIVLNSVELIYIDVWWWWW